MPAHERSLARLARQNRESEPDLSGHRAIVRSLTEMAERAIAGDAIDDAAFLAGVTAEFAWLNHPGMFADPALDDLLRRVGSSALGGASVGPGSSRPAGRGIVHVMTNAARLGGHSRLAWRWIETDADHRHSVVLTRPPRERLPPDLALAARERGGSLVQLDGPPSRRIVGLARIVADADAIVLHVDPGDVVAPAALAVPDRAPAILVNHADHVAWPGASIADTIACLRSSGLDLARRRRDVPSSRLALVPIPIPTPTDAPSAASRAAARTELGIPEDSIVVVSVASPYKFRPIDGLGMSDLGATIAAADGRFVLLVAGPTATGPWAEEEARTAGRVRALGPVDDLQPLFAASDLYLDSYPFASLTSLLEAGSHGLPLLALRDQPDSCAILAADSPGLDHLMTAASPAALVELIAETAEDPVGRASLGRRTAESIAARHSGPAWRAAVAEAMSIGRSAGTGATAHGPGDARPTDPEHGLGTPDRLDDRLVLLHRGLGGLDRAIAGRLGDRGLVDRVRLAAALGHEVRRTAMLGAIPPSMRRAIRRVVGSDR